MIILKCVRLFKVNKKIVLVIISLIVFISLVLFSNRGISVIANSGSQIQTQDLGLAYSTIAISSPINITSNSLLAAKASSGDGSSGNPYIIANVTISSCSLNSIGVNIQNTTDHFILRNITVSHCNS